MAWYWSRLAWTMIAAMAAAGSPASTLRLVSGPAGWSGKLALVGGPLDELGIVGAGVDGCAAGPLKATGCANADGDVPGQAHCS